MGIFGSSNDQPFRRGSYIQLLFQNTADRKHCRQNPNYFFLMDGFGARVGKYRKEE